MQVKIQDRMEEKELERMPDALLAAMFAGGVVVLPHEFETKKPPVQQPAASAAAPAPAAAPPLLAEAHAVPQQAPAEVGYLGNFSKKVLVVVEDPTALHLNDSDYQLLAKILGAVKLSMADIALVNRAVYQLEYYSLNTQLPASVALYFGLEPYQIGAPLKFPAFQVQAWNHTTFLHAPPLGQLNQNTPEAVALKKQLWEALRKIFSA
ncbi:MAG: hypothetical protein MUF24_13885 [Chitinophagaceae bacterium]|nr:hypothetical protein [Chitinophagaceae bacterium]